MTYTLTLKSRAVKDLKALPGQEKIRIVAQLEKLQNDLTGNVKRLTNFVPEYRLRVGNYRVLFEVEDNKIVVYRVVHRKDAYR